MRKRLGFTVVVLTGLATAGAQAMPLAPAWSGPGAVTLVRDGCGPYAHRSHFGYCKEDGPGPYGDERPRFEGGYGFEGGPRYGDGGYRGPRPGYDGPGYGGPRCFVRDTEDGPRRFCHY